MSKQQEHIKWLLGEINLWKQAGVIDENTQKALNSRYVLEEEDKTSAFIIIFASLASVLIGVGIISLFATNWDDFSKSTKTSLSFMPLVLGAGLFLFTLIKKSDRIAWKEASSGFLMLAFGATMGLVSQVYHVDGSLRDFLTTWLICSLPLVYIFRSHLVFLMYMYFAIHLGISMVGHSTLLQSWLIPFAVIPYFIHLLHKHTMENKTIVSTWVVTLGFGGLLFANFWETYGLLFVMMSSYSLMLYLVGKYYYGNQTNNLRQPMQSLSVLVVLVLSFIMTFIDAVRELLDEMVEDYFRNPMDSTHYFNVAVLLVFIGVGVYYYTKLKDKNTVNWFVLASPVFVCLDVSIHQRRCDFC